MWDCKSQNENENEKPCYIPVLGGYQKYSRVSFGHHLGILVWTSHGITLSDTLIKNLIVGSHTSENRLLRTGSRSSYIYIYIYILRPGWGLTLYPAEVLMYCVLFIKELAFSFFYSFEVEPKSFRFGFHLFYLLLTLFLSVLSEYHIFWYSSNLIFTKIDYKRFQSSLFNFFEKIYTLR